MTTTHVIKKTDAQRKADVLSELENVLLDASQIQVETDGNKVTLRGNVRITVVVVFIVVVVPPQLGDVVVERGESSIPPVSHPPGRVSG